jgi:VWFA-related protein
MHLTLWCVMTRSAHLLLLGLAGAGLFQAAPGDSDLVFRSDVSLVRVDVQVLDREHRAITDLRAEDFILREHGRPQEINYFGRDDVPADLLFLFDVSTSMRPHVERIAAAAHQALQMLGEKDRVAIMVFDRTMRLRMPFRNGRLEIQWELETMLRQESFHGGTDITRALVVAGSYIGLQARRDARRVIIILTDDQADFEPDDDGVSRAMERAGAVVCALIAVDNLAHTIDSPGVRTSWVGAAGFPRGIILGTQSAHTAEIARRSGGDSLSVDDDSALEMTLARIRQRYALHFRLPPDAQAGQERNIEVQLAENARRRHPDAELRFRRTYLPPAAPAGSGK